MKRPNSTKGGLLVGKTDKDGGKGIEVQAPEGKIIMGGGEVIINEDAAKQNCEELSRINQSTGGVAIPCDLQKQANTGKFEDGGKLNDNNDMENEELNKGIKIEKEHKNLYKELQDRLSAKGIKMPMTEDEFFTWIAKAHINEKSDYYTLLNKYVETNDKNTHSTQNDMEEQTHDLKSNAVNHEHKNILGATTLSWVTTNDGRHFYKVFEGEKNHEEVYEFYKNKGITVTHTIIDVVTHTSKTRDLSAIKKYVEKLVKEQFSADINPDTLFIPYTDHGDNGFTVNSFEFELLDGSKIKYDSHNQTLTKIMAKGGNIDSLIGKTVKVKNLTTLGKVGFKNDEGYYVKFPDGSDGFFDKSQLTEVADLSKEMSKGGKVSENWLKERYENTLNAAKAERESIKEKMSEDFKETEGGSGRTKAEILKDFDDYIKDLESKIKNWFSGNKKSEGGEVEKDKYKIGDVVEFYRSDDEKSDKSIGIIENIHNYKNSLIKHNYKDLVTFSIRLKKGGYTTISEKNIIRVIYNSKMVEGGEVESEKVLSEGTNGEDNLMAKGGNISKTTTYVPNKDIKDLSLVLKGQLKTIPGSDIVDGVHVKNAIKNKGKEKKVSSVDSKSIYEEIKLRATQQAWWNKTDEKSVLEKDIAELLKVGYDQRQIENIYLGYSYDRAIDIENEFDGSDNIFSYKDTSRAELIKNYIKAKKENKFELGVKYPDFDWSKIIKAFKISPTPKIIEYKHVWKSDNVGDYDVYKYQIFSGKNVVIGQYIGKIRYRNNKIYETIDEGTEIKNASIQSLYQKERKLKAGYNGGYWGIASSNIIVIDVIADMIIHESGYVKDLNLYVNRLGGIGTRELDENDIKYVKGGKLNNFNLKELSKNVGISELAIESYLIKNGFTDINGESLKLLTGLGRKQIKNDLISTAILGNPDNKYSKKLNEYLKSNKAFQADKKMVAGGVLTTDVQPEYPEGSEEIHGLMSAAKGGKLEHGGNVKELCPTGTVIQTLIFDKKVFSKKKANEWLKAHGFKFRIEITEDSYRARQIQPRSFKPTSFKTTDFDGKLPDGLKAVIGCLRANVKIK